MMNPEEQPQENAKPPVEEVTQAPAKTRNRALAIVLAVMVVIGGMVIGFFIGFSISFGACFKSSCSPVEQGAPLWIPVASLFITLPLAIKITKPRI